MKDVRARLNTMRCGQTITFLCLPIMVDEMCSTINENGGEVCALDMRNYGAVITAHKQQPPDRLPLFTPSP